MQLGMNDKRCTGLNTASEVFLIFTTQLYQYINVFFYLHYFSDKPEVFLPKYFQTAILHAAHLQRVVNDRLRDLVGYHSAKRQVITSL